MKMRRAWMSRYEDEGMDVMTYEDKEGMDVKNYEDEEGMDVMK